MCLWSHSKSQLSFCYTAWIDRFFSNELLRILWRKNWIADTILMKFRSQRSKKLARIVTVLCFFISWMTRNLFWLLIQMNEKTAWHILAGLRKIPITRSQRDGIWVFRNRKTQRKPASDNCPTITDSVWRRESVTLAEKCSLQCMLTCIIGTMWWQWSMLLLVS
jgi:hypothetical protein